VTKYTTPPIQKLDYFPFSISVRSYSTGRVFDINQGPQIFDLSALKITYVKGIPSFAPLRIEACTRKHWEKIPKLVQDFDVLQVRKTGCFPIN